MNLTYVLGAGASANSLPIVRDMDSRIKVFIDHLKKSSNLNEEESGQLVDMYKNIQQHYTIDTYAKKLFLKGKSAEKELFRLYNFMGAYFIYEQLRKMNEDIVSSYLFEMSINYSREEDKRRMYNSVIDSLDYRYDSFFATLLKQDINGNIFLPENINIVSWNYDSQLEISFMNFIDGSGLDDIQKKLNVFPNPSDTDLKAGSSVVKINGTAGFYSEAKKYGDLFDFRSHTLDQESMDALKEIIFQSRHKYKNTIYFAWNEDTTTIKARDYARHIISNTDILVVIGYSFPYFNRNIDRGIFKALEGRGSTIYIQTKEDSFQSIKNRAMGASSSFFSAIPFTELDQFLIPNEI